MVITFRLAEMTEGLRRRDMPKVRRGEKRSEYVKRAVHEMVHKEGLSPRQAVGKAEGMFDQAKKAKKKR